MRGPTKDSKEYEFRPAKPEIKSRIVLPRKLVASFLDYNKKVMDQIVEKTGCVIAVKLEVPHFNKGG
jgi:hypothetical protein